MDLKLNMDGLAINAATAGGGVIQDDVGNASFGYVCSLGTRSIMLAEAKALLFGLNICARKQLVIQEVECDSKVLVDSIKGIVLTPWCINSIVKKCRILLQNVPIKHIYRKVMESQMLFPDLGTMELTVGIQTSHP